SIGTAPAKKPPIRRLGRADGSVSQPKGASRGSANEPGGNARGAEAMENALLIGLSRQMALQRELDVVANNIANLNTTGYKADGDLFQEYMSPIARSERFQRPDRPMSFVLDRATWHDLGQGPLQQTGNPLDVAIDGNAFLAVQTPRGERYTRNGALQINAHGELVTGEGYQVIGDNGPIVLQPGDPN